MFNARLLKLIKNEQRARGSPDYPKVYFHDLYTPENHRAWRNFTKSSSKGVKIGWSDEPDFWVARTMGVLIPYLRIQCAASYQRRELSEQNKQRRELTPDNPTVEQPKKKSAFAKNTSFNKRRPRPTNGNGEESEPKKLKTGNKSRLSSSPKYSGEANFEKKVDWRK
jgi:hypothetical protein